jgi:hypothetical protein
MSRGILRIVEAIPLRHLGAVLLAAAVLHLWGTILQVGGLVADPFSEIPPLERVSGLFVLSLTRGGFQMIAGWYIWRHGEGVASEAVPYGALLLVRFAGTLCLVLATLIEVAAAFAVLTQDLILLEITSLISLPVLSFGFLLFWLGSRLPPPQPKKAKPEPRPARAQQRRRR